MSKLKIKAEVKMWVAFVIILLSILAMGYCNVDSVDLDLTVTETIDVFND